jgi:uncharacterized delta-60 repeat protein
MGGATGTDICLARFNVNGSLDSSFDGDGRVTTAISAGAASDFAHGVDLYADGRIVVAGYCDGGASGQDMCVARYNADGSLDTSFDADGYTTTAVASGARSDTAYAVVVQADGKVVAAGMCNMDGVIDLDVCLVRYNVDGSLDTSFDGDGRVTTPINPSGVDDRAYAIAQQPDGRLVIAGYCNMPVGGWDACLARYNVDGSLDLTFDSDGLVTTSTAAGFGSDVARAVAIQPDGRIVTAGYCAMGGATGNDACIARYNTDGSLDTSFDSDGRVTTATAPGTGSDDALAVAMLPDGRIVTSGLCDMGGATGIDACLAAYLNDGSLDLTFDGDGRVTTATAPGTGLDYAHAIVAQADGALTTAGYCNMGGATGFDFCLARYSSGGVIDQYNDGGGDDWDTAGSSIGLFGACLSATTLSTPAWTVNASCPTDDGAFWQPVPTTASAVATANPLTSTATATIRFGVRVADDYPTGDYIAPVTFSVSAP